MLENMVYYSVEDVNKLDMWKDLTDAYYTNENVIAKLENKRDALTEIIKEYGDNKAITEQLAKIANEISTVNAGMVRAAEIIGGAKGLDALDDECINYARARDFAKSGTWRNLKGDDGAVYRKMAKRVHEVIENVRERFEAMDEDGHNRRVIYGNLYTGNKVLEIVTREEYKALRRCAETVAYKLFDDKSKYKGADIGYLIIASIKAKNGTIEPFGEQKILKNLVTLVNSHNFKNEENK